MKKLRQVLVHATAVCICFLAIIFVYGVKTHAAEVTITIAAGSTASEIQQALDEAKENATDSQPYKIVIAPGEYVIDQQLKISSNTHLYMNGATLINNIYKKGKYQNMVRFGYSSDEPTGYNGWRNITLEGGIWDGGSSDAALLHFSHSNHIVIKNMTFRNVTSSHHAEFAGCNDVTVTGCTFADYNGKTTSNNEALQMDILNEQHFSDGSYDDTPCRNVTVSNCKFQNLQRGIGTHNAIIGSYFENITIKNCSFNQISGYAIVATNYRNANISSNTIQNAGAGIMFRTMIQGDKNFYYPNAGMAAIQKNANSTITNNKITVTNIAYSTTSYGIQLYGENRKADKNNIPKGDFRISGVKVSGNTIELKDSGYGIWTQGADSITLSSNKINMNTPSNGDGKGNGDGIRSVNSTAVTIQSNTITHGKKTTKNKKACGILLDSNSDGIVKSNTINNSIVNGIKVQTKSKATICFNKVNACGGDGIYVSSNATAPVIQSNTIKKCKKYGINYLNKKGKVTITKNKFSKNKKKLKVKAKGKIQKK